MAAPKNIAARLKPFRIRDCGTYYKLEQQQEGSIEVRLLGVGVDLDWIKEGMRAHKKMLSAMRGVERRPT